MINAADGPVFTRVQLAELAALPADQVYAALQKAAAGPDGSPPSPFTMAMVATQTIRQLGLLIKAMQEAGDHEGVELARAFRTALGNAMLGNAMFAGVGTDGRQEGQGSD